MLLECVFAAKNAKVAKELGGRLHALDGTESGEIVKFYEAGNYSKKIW